MCVVFLLYVLGVYLCMRTKIAFKNRHTDIVLSGNIVNAV